jgi:hypothetical protein
MSPPQVFGPVLYARGLCFFLHLLWGAIKAVCGLGVDRRVVAKRVCIVQALKLRLLRCDHDADHGDLIPDDAGVSKKWR